MMSRVTGRLHERRRRTGRVYQLHPGRSRVAIDWAPPASIHGNAVLTGGTAVYHPTEGKVVYFPGERRRRGRVRIAVRTGARADLLELFELAIKLSDELSSEIGEVRSRSNRSRVFQETSSRPEVNGLAIPHNSLSRS